MASRRLALSRAASGYMQTLEGRILMPPDPYAMTVLEAVSMFGCSETAAKKLNELREKEMATREHQKQADEINAKAKEKAAEPYDIQESRAMKDGEAEYIQQREKLHKLEQAAIKGMVKQSILDKAKEVTEGDRNTQYGDPDVDFKRTAGMWSAFLKDRLTGDIEPHEVGWMMAMLKASREQHQGKEDNYIDALGYIRCAARCRGYEEW